MRWQYRTIVFEFAKDGLLGDRYLDDEAMEQALNEQGQQGWELVSTTVIQEGVLALLKRPSSTTDLCSRVEPSAAQDGGEKDPTGNRLVSAVEPDQAADDDKTTAVPAPEQEQQPAGQPEGFSLESIRIR